MARDFTNNSANYLDGGDVAGVTSVFTIHCWVQLDTATVERKIFARWASGGANQQYLLETNGTPHKARLLVRDAVGSVTVTGATTVGTGVWYPLGGRVRGTGGGDIAVFLNGSSDGTGTGKIPQATTQPLKIGRDGAGQPFDGRVAEAAIWNVALSDAEMLALAKGISPLRLRRSALVGYWPLYGAHATSEVDLSGNGIPLAVNGTVGAAAHAPVEAIVTPAI